MNDIDLMLKEGIAAAKSGNKELAYPLLIEATNRNPESELAWLWLAGVSKSPQEALKYLRKVLALNPNNKRALAGVKWAEQHVSTPVQVESEQGDSDQEEIVAEAVWECPFCLTTSQEEIAVCIECKAHLSLKDIDALLNNRDVDHQRLSQSIPQLKNDLAITRNYKNLFNIALAYINLGQVETGLTFLKEASALHENDVDLIQEVNEISSRLQATEVEVVEETKTVMIVDDSPTICRLVSFTLERDGYQVITASDGFEAIAKLNDGIPDLILLDITMPRMDGYQLCKTIKGNPETEFIPIIMLSGKDGFIDKVRGRMVGSDDYITKPFEPEELMHYVNKYINQSNEAHD